MKRRIISITLILTMALFICTAVSVQASSSPSEWAVNEINAAVEEGLVTDSVMENYQADITREQFCEMIVLAYEKISGNTAEKGSIVFDDTNNEQILKASNLGIVTGYGDGSFGPNDLITREQIAAMLVRMVDAAVSYANVNVYNNNYFADGDMISDWALASINFAYDKELMQGVGGNRIDPLANTTCEQAILLVYRAFEKYSYDDDDKLLNSFIEQAVGYGSDYLYFISGDYDNNGEIEAFGITGDEENDMGYHPNADIWYIDSSGNCTNILSDTYGVLYDNVFVENGQFLVWEQYAGGSGGMAVILGVKNGTVFEPNISRSCDMFRYENGDYVATMHDFSKGYHDYIDIYFTYDAQTREFIKNTTNTDDFDYTKIINGDFSDFAGVRKNANGNELTLQVNGMDGEDSNGNFRFFVEDIKLEADGSYSWAIMAYYNGNPVDGYRFILYPKGINVVSWDGNIIYTDNSEVRLWSGNGSVESADSIYYKQ